MTESIRPLSRLIAKELTERELESVSGGAKPTTTSTVCEIRSGGFTADDNHADDD